MTDILREIEKPALKTGVPEFAPGDAIRVHVRVREGDKERIQIFAGVVIARRSGGTRETFTVRKVSSGSCAVAAIVSLPEWMRPAEGRSPAPSWPPP